MIEPYKTKAVNRLKKIRGQVDGLIKMIDEDKACVDIITQSLALQGALRNVTPLLLESHLNTCGAENLASKKPAVKDQFIKELVRAFNLSSR